MSGTAETSERYLYQVHPSYKSQTAIRVTRKQLPPPPTPQAPMQPENPYVFKPKSYSKKRNFRETISPSHVTPPLPKKFKPNIQDIQTSSPLNTFDKKFVLSQLKGFAPSFLKEGCREKQKIQSQSIMQLPLKLATSDKVRKNPLLSHQIEIVSTNNEKLSISIHEGLLKSNMNHSKQEQTLEGIVNPFNAKLKRQFSEKIQFVRDYKSGYTPIELQNRSKKQEEKQMEEEGKKEKAADSTLKTHFIKKKQSTLSLARTCGVSYIRPSQSVQQAPFESLPPLIFQCSTSCNYTNELRAKYQGDIDKFITLSENRWLPAIMTTEDKMRDLLLGKPFGKVIWVNGIKNLWPLFNEGTFLLVLFDLQMAINQEQVWNQFNSSVFKFGILAKKSTSGKKLFMKSIQIQSFDKNETTSVQGNETIDEKTNRTDIQVSQPVVIDLDSPLNGIKNEEKKQEESPPEERKQCKDVCQEFAKELKNCRTVTTMSLKFEMYVHEQFWKGQTSEGKNLLNGIILSFQESLQKKALEVIRDRLELVNKDQRQQILSVALEKIRVGQEITSFAPMRAFSYPRGQEFTLKNLQELNYFLQARESITLGQKMQTSELFKDKEGRENKSLWEKSLKMPIYYISTRDSFAFDLVQKVTVFSRQGRPYQRIEYYFEADNYPGNYGQYKKLFPNLDTGVVCYHNFFSEEQLQLFEARTLQTQTSAFKNKFLQMTVQPTIIGNRIKRTKFFFGYRYMWTRCQLAEPLSYVGAGVRRDVTPPPEWIQQVQSPMVEHGIVEQNFLNSVAINVYHDGTEGLAQHFDDAVRFRQPIYTLRLVSDGRLSFGSQFYGFCNGAFIIPLPRGCICVMNENSYAANGVKHCVRPCDMSGKSAAIIMRQMHHQVVREASKYDELIDFPAWLSTLSEDPKATTFAEQKRREAQQILADEEKRKEKEKAAKAIGTSAHDL